MSIKKNYYADPIYREKHLAYMKVKVPCPDGCGTITGRCNMHHHRTTQKHIKFMEQNTIANKIIKLLTKEQLKRLAKELKKLNKEN